MRSFRRSDLDTELVARVQVRAPSAIWAVASIASLAGDDVALPSTMIARANQQQHEALQDPAPVAAPRRLRQSRS